LPPGGGNKVGGAPTIIAAMAATKTIPIADTRYSGHATVVRDYSEEIAAKNRAYVEAARNTTDMIRLAY
jgi:hypothetical protein